MRQGSDDSLAASRPRTEDVHLLDAVEAFEGIGDVDLGPVCEIQELGDDPHVGMIPVDAHQVVTAVHIDLHVGEVGKACDLA